MSNSYNSSVFAISFDGVALSGITAEFLKVAKILHQAKYNVYLDLGYEIKADKNSFFKPYGKMEQQLFPDWVKLIKVLPIPFKKYSRELVEQLLAAVPEPVEVFSAYRDLIADYSAEIAKRFIKLWQQLKVRIVIVENGTLPENIIFTQALYQAIHLYGKANHLGKFVFWRDHDLMWSSESHINKYGAFPYSTIIKPKPSSYINYIVLHQADYEALRNWSPGIKPYILQNSFQNIIQEQPDSQAARSARSRFRKEFNIPDGAVLLARYTRIIPQKRIDRDVDLLYTLHQFAKSRQQASRFYLAIAGDLSEHPAEAERLRNKIQSLALEDQVIFTGPLLPTETGITEPVHDVRSLIMASDLCLFLTSYNYESFGNPVAEAICLGRVYVTTHYERYHHVYGQYGYKGIILNIDKEDQTCISQKLIMRIYELLDNQNDYESIVRHNRTLMQQQQKLQSSLSASLHRILEYAVP